MFLLKKINPQKMVLGNGFRFFGVLMGLCESRGFRGLRAGLFGPYRGYSFNFSYTFRKWR